MIVIADWLRLNAEILGLVFSSLYVVFAIKEKPLAWIFGGIGAVFCFFAYYENKFYANMSLQFYYVAISIYGFWNWKRGKKGAAQEVLRVSALSLKEWGWTVLGILVCFTIYVSVLIKFTDYPLSFISIGDSFTTAACIVATYLATKKRLENWLIFFVSDSVAIGLCIHQKMYPLAVLFTIYSIMAVIGYWQWRKELLR